MEVAKKRGRPSKGGSVATAAINSSANDLPTIPKKRGRPAKIKGRGGRPKKYGSPTSDAEQNESEKANGGEMKPVSKGRGRPAKTTKVESESDDESSSSSSSGMDVKPVKSQASQSPAKRRKLGRPKKHQPSDEDSCNDDDDERRPVGRPATGAVNLNIVRTGRGPGRPKKGAVAYRAAAAESNGDGTAAVPKKRGRPPAANKQVCAPSGRGRGRPKSKNADGQAADDDDEQNEASATDTKDTKDTLTESDGDEGGSSAKKRGRPAGVPAKARGRPKAQNDADDQHDAKDGDATVSNEDEGVSSKKRGRPPVANKPLNASSVKPQGRAKQADGFDGDAENSKGASENDEKKEHKQSMLDDNNSSNALNEDSAEEVSDTA